MSVLGKRKRDDPRKLATEQAFLQATESLLREGVSFADLSVSRVADRAGRTRTAFYAHFEDRRALLLAVIEGLGDHVFTALAPFLQSVGPIRPEDVHESISGLLQAFRDHAAQVGAVVEAAGYDETIADYWAAIVYRVIEAARGRFEAQGIPAGTALAIATPLVWMTERTCYQQSLRQDTGLTDAETVAGLGAVWLAAAGRAA